MNNNVLSFAGASLLGLVLALAAGCASLNQHLLDTVGPTRVCAEMEDEADARRFRSARTQHYLLLAASMDMLIGDLEDDFASRSARRSPPFTAEEALAAREAFEKTVNPLKAKRRSSLAESRRWEGVTELAPPGSGDTWGPKTQEQRMNAEERFCREQIPHIMQSREDHLELLGQTQETYKAFLSDHGLSSKKAH